MASGDVKTYNPKQIVISVGTQIVTGIADDSFVTIEPNGDGTTKKVGCDGEIVRAISPDDTYKVKITLLQTSDCNPYFSELVDRDRETGDGIVPMLIKDLKGGLVFSTDAAWLTKKAPVTRGKADNNREWEFDTGKGELKE